MIYFIKEPYFGQITFFDDERSFIEGLKSFDFEAYCDDGWCEDVKIIIAGKCSEKWVEGSISEHEYYDKHKTHITKSINNRDRPDESEIDEDGYDREGTYWGEFTHICWYQFEEIGSENN